MRSTLLSILLLRKIRGRWSFLWSFQCTAMDMMIWRIRFTQIFRRPSVGIILILCRSFRWMVQVRTASPSSTVFATSTTSVCYLALLVCNGTFGYLFGNLRSHGSPWQILISRAIQFLSRCNVAKYFQYYECCYLYQVATILQAITLSEGAQVIQVLQAFLYCLGSSSCQVCFKLPWVEAIVKQCLSWSLHIHFAAELSLYLLVACLLCPHYLLTLCSWKPSSLTAVSPFECSACPSNVRVGVDGMSVHGSKSSVVHSVPEGAFSSLLVLQSVKPSVLEIFLLIIQVFERLVNLSTAIHFPDSVRKMRESCPGLTEQIMNFRFVVCTGYPCALKDDLAIRALRKNIKFPRNIECPEALAKRSEANVVAQTRSYSRASLIYGDTTDEEMHPDTSAMVMMSYRRMFY